MVELTHAARIEALDETWQIWVQLGDGLDEQQWSRPTRCPGWDVRCVYAHHSVFPAALMSPPTSSEGPMAAVSAQEVLRRFNAPEARPHALARIVADAAVTEAAQTESRELVDRFRLHGPEAIAALRRTPADTLVAWPGASATVTLVEALRIVLLEAAVHLLDLQRALDQPSRVPVAALRSTAYLLADLAPMVELIEAATGRVRTSPLPVLR